MPRSQSRRFSLLDALILVAAVAVMLWFFRVRFEPKELPASSRSAQDYLVAARWIEGLLPCASAWTMAVLVLRLRGPRPTVRRLYRQPGFTACLTASLVVLLGVPIGALGNLEISWLLNHSFRDVMFDGVYTLGTLGNLPPRISLAVASAWVAQAVSSHWRPEPSWIDRLGRAVGVFWIAMIPVYEFAGVGCLGS